MDGEGGAEDAAVRGVVGDEFAEVSAGGGVEDMDGAGVFEGFVVDGLADHEPAVGEGDGGAELGFDAGGGDLAGEELGDGGGLGKGGLQEEEEGATNGKSARGEGRFHLTSVFDKETPRLRKKCEL